jgi:hypothetical protein
MACREGAMSSPRPGLRLRDELHYGDRVVPCHVGRPPNLIALIAATSLIVTPTRRSSPAADA